MYLLQYALHYRVRVSLTGYARHATILLYIGTDSGPISTGEDGVPIMLVW